MKKLLLTLTVLFLFTGQAKAADFNSFDDVANLLSSDALIYYCSTCTPDGNDSKLRNWTPSLGGLPDVDTTGLATDDLFRYDGTNFLPLNIDEIIEGSGGSTTVRIGSGSTATNTQSLAIGRLSNSTGFSSTAIGTISDSTGSQSIAVGRSSDALADNAIAIGHGAAVSHANSIALGESATTTEANQIMMGTATETVHIPGDLEVTGNSRTPSQFTEKTASYTLTAADLGGTIYYNSTGNGTLTIPSGLSINNGDFVGFVQGNTGTISLASSGTMTLNTFTGFTTKGQYASGAVHFRSSTEGIVKGELE